MSAHDTMHERPVLRLDAKGRIIWPSEEEMRARAEASIRAMDELSSGPPATPEEIEEDLDILRGIDNNRPPGARKPFEGYY